MALSIITSFNWKFREVINGERIYESENGERLSYSKSEKAEEQLVYSKKIDTACRFDENLVFLSSKKDYRLSASLSQRPLLGEEEMVIYNNESVHFYKDPESDEIVSQINLKNTLCENALPDFQRQEKVSNEFIESLE